MTATHRNIAAMVEEGSFRRDLFFRINVVSLEVPSLNRRKEDIPLLLDFALDKFNQKYGNKMMQLRILAQAIAVVLILLYIWLRGSGGQ